MPIEFSHENCRGEYERRSKNGEDACKCAKGNLLNSIFMAKRMAELSVHILRESALFTQQIPEGFCKAINTKVILLFLRSCSMKNYSVLSKFLNSIIVFAWLGREVKRIMARN